MAPTAKDLGPLAESLTASPTPSASPKDPAATHGDPAARQIFTSPNTSGADATGGDPPAPQILSSPLLGPHASSASPQPYMNMPADLGGYLSSSVLPPSLRLASDLLHYPEQDPAATHGDPALRPILISPHLITNNPHYKRTCSAQGCCRPRQLV